MIRNFWDEIERMHEEMDNLYQSMYGSPKQNLIGHRDVQDRHTRTPICNMCWEKGSLIAQFELPGVDKEDIELNIGEGYLEVKVDSREEAEKKDKDSTHYYSQRRSFYRQIPLPEAADTGKAQAEFNNGLLKITMPKREIEEKTKKLEIK